MPMVQVAVVAFRGEDGMPGPAIPLYQEISEEEAEKKREFLEAAADIMAERYMKFRERKFAELEAEKKKEEEKAALREARLKEKERKLQ